MTSNKEQPDETTTPPSAPVLGPWTQTTVTKLNVSALEVTMTKTVECSHVPPEEPLCRSGSGSGSGASTATIMDFLQQAAQVIVAKLDEIRAGQQDSDDMH